MTVRLVAFVLVAWCIPPLLAGAFGWHGIWGSGSALWDFLSPLPISGGVLHVPSLLAAMSLVALRQKRDKVLPAGFAAVAMVSTGAVLLVDMNDLSLALATDMALPSASRLLSNNPLGLFLVSDGLLALLWPHAHGDAVSPKTVVIGCAAVIGVPLLLMASMYRQAPIAQYQILPGLSQQGPSRGDELAAVYTTTAMEPTVLQQALAATSFASPPQMSVNVEDQAVYFYDSYEAAQRLAIDSVRLTWCRYEDGTPERWLPGAGDCFSDHVNFSERFADAYDRVDPRHSPGARGYVALLGLCQSVTLVEDASFSAVAGQRECAANERAREELIARGQLNDFDREVLNVVQP